MPDAPPTFTGLTDAQALRLTKQAFALADDEQWNQLDGAVPPGLRGGDPWRAYVAVAMRMDPPLLTAPDLEAI